MIHLPLCIIIANLECLVESIDNLLKSGDIVNECMCPTQRSQLYTIVAHQLLKCCRQLACIKAMSCSRANSHRAGVDFKVIEIAYHMYLIVT